MPRASYEIDISAPPAAVFAFLSDFSNDPKWRANVVQMKPLGRAEESGGVWSRQIEVRKVPGRTVESEAVVTAFEPGATLSVQRASGPIRPHAIYRLTPAGAGTRLHFELQIALTGAAWLAFPLVWLFVTLAIRPVLPKDFGRLKQLLEAR
jgi:hypothetical protein